MEWKTDNSIETLDVLEPKMLIHDELKVIYINEAFEEAQKVEGSEYKAMLLQAKADHPDYPTRLRRIPITVDFMKYYAQLTRDTYLIDLIARKEDQLRGEGELYEISDMYAFKNMFLARHGECRNMYKAMMKVKAYEEAHPELGKSGLV